MKNDLYAWYMSKEESQISCCLLTLLQDFSRESYNEHSEISHITALFQLLCDPMYINI